MRFKPGQIVLRSGQYRIVGVNGIKLKKEVTCVKGERFPPTPRKNQTYELEDATNNKSGIWKK